MDINIFAFMFSQSNLTRQREKIERVPLLMHRGVSGAFCAKMGAGRHQGPRPALFPLLDGKGGCTENRRRGDRTSPVAGSGKSWTTRICSWTTAGPPGRSSRSSSTDMSRRRQVGESGWSRYYQSDRFGFEPSMPSDYYPRHRFDIRNFLSFWARL
jgi:hypothetical protein